MSTIQQQIAALEQRRSAIYSGAAGRALTTHELAQIKDIARALDAAWQLRRHQQASQPAVDHELVLVRELGR